MEFLTLLAIVFLIKSTIGILDTLITTFEDMSPLPEILNDSSSNDLITLRQNRIECFIESIRYIINRQNDTSIFLICATYLFYVI